MRSRPTIRARTQKLCRCFPQRLTLVLLFLGLDLICLPNHAHCLWYQISGHGGESPIHLLVWVQMLAPQGKLHEN